MRFEVETNIYNPSALARKFASIQTSFDVTLGKIAAIISDSEIQQYLDGHTTMNTRLSSVVQDINGVHSQISAMQTEYSDGFDLVDSQLSTVDQTLSGIRAEVSTVHSEYQNLETRIASAETKIEPDAIINTVRSSQSYKTDINAKSATYTGDYVPTTSNLPASSWTTSEMKQSHLNDTFLTSGGEVYQYISGHNGLMITFTYDSETEATRYDYVRIYFKIGETTYVLPDIGGTDISGASVFVPSNEFWLYWRSDSSVTKYGFKIASIEWTFSNTPTLVEATLPGLTPTATSGTTYPETTHPYTNNEEKFWKYSTANTSSVSPSYGWAERGNHGIDSIAERLTNTEERVSVAELKITDSAIVSTVTSSSFGQAVTSTIKQTSDGIHLDAKYVSWNSIYSTMTKNGDLAQKRDNTKMTLGSFSYPIFSGSHYSGITVRSRTGTGFAIEPTNAYGKAKYYIVAHQQTSSSYNVDSYITEVQETTYGGGDLLSTFGYNETKTVVVNALESAGVYKKYYNSISYRDGFRIMGAKDDASDLIYFLGLTQKRFQLDIGGSGDFLGFAKMQFNPGSSGDYWEFRTPDGMISTCIDDRGLCVTTSPFSRPVNSSTIVKYNDITIQGQSVARQSSSSRRYKHSIQPLKDDKLDPKKLLGLRVVQFVYNDDAKLQYIDTKDKTLPGFIAEEVAEIYPSAVIHHRDTGEIESWDERRIIPGMLSLIQELYQRVKELESRLKDSERSNV